MKFTAATLLFISLSVVSALPHNGDVLDKREPVPATLPYILHPISTELYKRKAVPATLPIQPTTTYLIKREPEPTPTRYYTLPVEPIPSYRKREAEPEPVPTRYYTLPVEPNPTLKKREPEPTTRGNTLPTVPNPTLKKRTVPPGRPISKGHYTLPVEPTTFAEMKKRATLTLPVEPLPTV